MRSHIAEVDACQPWIIAIATAGRIGLWTNVDFITVFDSLAMTQKDAE
jgi:hypothetical protein